MLKTHEKGARYKGFRSKLSKKKGDSFDDHDYPSRQRIGIFVDRRKGKGKNENDKKEEKDEKDDDDPDNLIFFEVLSTKNIYIIHNTYTFMQSTKANKR